MVSFRQILVATDFSDCSARALETTAALATRFHAEVTVLHVIEESAYAYPFPMPKGVREAAKARLDETVARLRGRMLSASGVLREGFAAHEVCAGAAQRAADLVVIGSHGRSGLPRFVHGSVAERVVRLSPAPVLTVHPSDGVAALEGGTNHFRHILAPTDFSEASRRGVDLALNMALELEAALTLVHLYELPGSAYYVSDDFAPPGYAGYVPDDFTSDVEARARWELDTILASVRRRFPKAEGVVRRGNAWNGILDVAKESGADVVVLSTHGRQGLQRVLIGSVAEKIVRLSPVPVVTVGVVGRESRTGGTEQGTPEAP